MGGPDQDWNIITLSVEDHAYAHELLYENYENYFDLCAACMLKGQIEEGFDAMRKANQEKMKELGVGFYNSELQRELAKRPKKQRECYARNLYVKAALQRGGGTTCYTTKKIIRWVAPIIEPFECSSLAHTFKRICTFKGICMKGERESWHQYEKKEKSYWITGLTRTLTGHVCKKTGKHIPLIGKGWRVLGTHIPLKSGIRILMNGNLIDSCNFS